MQVLGIRMLSALKAQRCFCQDDRRPKIERFENRVYVYGMVETGKEIRDDMAQDGVSGNRSSPEMQGLKTICR